MKNKDSRVYADGRLDVIENQVHEIAQKTNDIFIACNNINVMLDNIKIEDASMLDIGELIGDDEKKILESYLTQEMFFALC